jgi:hypothetical protein
MTEETTAKAKIELGHISLHRDMPQRIPFSDAYYAIRRHEMGERQPGTPKSLDQIAESDSRETGCIVSYHVSTDFLVFQVVTCPQLGETRVAMAVENPFAKELGSTSNDGTAAKDKEDGR